MEMKYCDHIQDNTELMCDALMLYGKRDTVLVFHMGCVTKAAMLKAACGVRKLV